MLTGPKDAHRAVCTTDLQPTCTRPLLSTLHLSRAQQAHHARGPADSLIIAQQSDAPANGALGKAERLLAPPLGHLERLHKPLQLRVLPTQLCIILGEVLVGHAVTCCRVVGFAAEESFARASGGTGRGSGCAGSAREAFKLAATLKHLGWG